MKKPLIFVVVLILALIFFLAGARFNQHQTSQNPSDTGERKILHYVDPMNPANTSKEPGLAPCGMPMEPVYAEDEAAGDLNDATMTVPASAGAVKVSNRKQQLIGVQMGEVGKAAQTVKIRTLGRITPDENKIYPLVAATDGWMGEIHESTTGSLVGKDQLMGKIRIYDYDFFTWQQRYLIELGNSAGRRRPPIAPLYDDWKASQLKKAVSAQQQAGSLHPDIGAPILHNHSAGRGSMETNAGPAEQNSSVTAANHSRRSGDTARAKRERRAFTGRDDRPYPSQVQQELMDLGLAEGQLEQLATTGVYLTDVELRSPVDGLVLARKVSPHERIEKGTECFRIADLSRVWVEADIYDSEAEYIEPGTEAQVSLPGMNRYFPATVSEVLPRFDASGRTLKVRLEMANPRIQFRPDMFVDVELLPTLPEAISVPAAAVIDSGAKETVYVAVAEGVFEPRQVMSGWRFNNLVEIVHGLQVGEKIVVSGNFLIDSESRMKLAASRLTEEVAAEPSGNQASHMPHMPAKMNSPRKSLTAGKVRDLICGMYIDPVKAEEAGLFIESEGKTYYFCSEECAEEFHRHGPQLEDSMNQIEMTDDQAGSNRHDLAQMDMSPASSAAKQTARDPVCGMPVDEKTAAGAGLMITEGDETHFFCSEQCKHQFEQNPQSYSNSQQSAESADHMGHTP